MSNNEMTRRTAADDVQALAAGQANLYSTITGDSMEARLAILSAVTDSEPVIDHIGETFQLRHVIVQASSVADEDGNETDAVRVIVIDEDGNAWHAMSKGLFTYMRNLFDIVGNPKDWTQPLPVQFVEKRGRNGFRFLTVKLAETPKAPAAKATGTAKGDSATQ